MSSDHDFDPARYRQVLGHFPTGVTIVTGMDGEIPAGFTIGSFSSISLEPPLVGFFPQISSETWDAIAPSERFCVNILGSHQGAACWDFARRDADDRFDSVEWQLSPTGSPILTQSIAWIDCLTESVQEIGDHYLVVGRVVALSNVDADPSPLVFYRGKLGEFSPLAS